MNYRHIYHAGSFTDVFKHIVLTALLTSFTRKDTACCYIDTHAGIGYYDLMSENASKTKEFETGIEKIIQQDNPPPLVKQFLDCVHSINNKLSASKYASLRYYPGSPMIARSLLRPHDRIVACELHPDDYRTLKNAFINDNQTSIHHADGFLSLKAFLPPVERRGLVLIDPPYENPDEFTRIAQTLPSAIKRWPTGTYAIWYPIKEKRLVDKFYRKLQETFDLPILALELTIYPDLANHLNGSGMAIINPPYQFDTNIAQVMPWLWNALTINGQGEYRSIRLK